MSTRVLVQRGDQQGIGGLIITGNEPKRVIIRALGPSLAQQQVNGALADPVLRLHGPNGEFLVANDNWRDTQEREIQESGIAPRDDAESAIVITLPPANYTAIVGGKNETSGVGLVEVYDLDSDGAARLGNLSTRGFVQTEGNVLIGGFILGAQEANANIIIRGIGPSLAKSGISNPLGDPTLQLRNEDGELLVGNDNWQDDPDQAAQIRASGIEPEDERESAIAASLRPGNYTATLAGRNDGTGIGIVEVYSRE